MTRMTTSIDLTVTKDKHQMEGKVKSTVFSGGTSIISSGVVISFHGNPIEIVIEPIENAPYSIVFSFHKDENRKESYIQARNLDGKVGIELLLFNFTNSLGTATTKPISFATANEDGVSKQLYVNFAVSTVGEASPTLQYTVYKDM